MQDSKDINWGSDYNDDADTNAADVESEVQAADTDNSGEPDGWQQYRRWISKAPAPNRRRSSVDPSLYTWKGYRDWSEQIKRNWSENS